MCLCPLQKNVMILIHNELCYSIQSALQADFQLSLNIFSKLKKQLEGQRENFVMAILIINKNTFWVLKILTLELSITQALHIRKHTIVS